MINGNWNKDNIHLLLCLNQNLKTYKNLLNDYNVDLLIKILQKESLINLINAKYQISKEISEKIITIINGGNWNKDNIHLLLCLDPISKGYDNLLNDYNIDLLIKLLQKKSLTNSINTKRYITQKISKSIIEYCLRNKKYNEFQKIFNVINGYNILQIFLLMQSKNNSDSHTKHKMNELLLTLDNEDKKIFNIVLKEIFNTIDQKSIEICQCGKTIISLKGTKSIITSAISHLFHKEKILQKIKQFIFIICLVLFLLFIIPIIKNIIK